MKTTATLRLLGSLLLVATLLPTSPAHAADDKKPRKFALLVGIDHYGAKYTPEVAPGEQWTELDGAGNDVQALAAELVRRGFDVVVLRDDKATHKGIVDAFRAQLVDKVKPGRGDVVLFHFSGHGQQVPDDNGEPDEADGYDETIVPFDNLGIKNYSKHIRDDEIGVMLAAVKQKTDNVVVFLDSCHSGTATRGTSKKRGHAPAHEPAKRRGANVDGPGALGIVANGEAAGAGYVFFAAVRADQEANEAVDPKTRAPMGAFTFLLVKALQESGPKTTYQQLLDRIGVQIVGITSNQNPSVEGDAHKVLFSGEWTAASKYFRVRPADKDGSVPIEAGSLHGLGVGSILAIYPPGATEDSKPLGTIKVDRVELGLAYGRPTPNSPNFDVFAMSSGAQAVEVYSQHSPARLKVAIKDHGDVLGPAFKRLRFVEIVSAKETSGAPAWDLRVVSHKGLAQIQRADGSPVPIPRGKDQRMDDGIAPADPAFADRISMAVEAQFRRAKVAMLDNGDSGSKMDVTLGVKRVKAVLEAGPDGRRRPKITAVLGDVKKDGSDKVKAGEILQFTVKNSSEKVAFYTILELSTDGSVGVLFPMQGMAGGDNRLEPGKSRVIEVPFRMTPPGGTQVFKLIATEDDIDFRGLEYQVKRGEKRGATRGASSPLARMMGEVMDVKRSEPFGYAPEKLWGTDAARIEIVE